MAARLSLTQGAARSLLRQAKALRGMPKVAAAQAAGELGSRQAQVSPSARAPEQDNVMMSLGNPP